MDNPFDFEEMLMLAESSRPGYRYVVSWEQIRKYKALSPKEKLEWLEEANEFVNKFLPERSRRIQEKFRRGEI